MIHFKHIIMSTLKFSFFIFIFSLFAISCGKDNSFLSSEDSLFDNHIRSDNHLNHITDIHHSYGEEEIPRVKLIMHMI